MPEALIRRAGLSDARALAALAAETFAETFGHLYPPADLAAFLRETYDVDRMAADLADPAQAIWLLELDGAPAGFAQAGPCGLPHPQATPACGELKRLYLRGPAQRAGWGGRLFDAALAWLQSAGPRSVWIGVWSENFGAQRFYARRGYRKVGEYGFPVGATLDREFILMRPADAFAREA